MAMTKRRSEAKTLDEKETISAFGFDPEEVEARCLVCGERVWNPAMIWVGVLGTMYLHPDCAFSIAKGLSIDVNNYFNGGKDV